MRLLIPLLIAFAATAAAAKPRIDPQGPHVARGAPYTSARAQIIKQGYEPVRVLEREFDDTCGYYTVVCGRYPELMSCSAESWCNFLFRRRSDGVYFLVTTGGEFVLPDDMRYVTVDNTRRASKNDFSGFVIAKPSHAGRARGP